MELTEDEVIRFVDACADLTNAAAREAMRTAEATSASGVIARFILSSGDDRDVLLELIRLAVRGVPATRTYRTDVHPDITTPPRRRP